MNARTTAPVVPAAGGAVGAVVHGMAKLYTILP